MATIRLRSCDGEVFEIDEEIAKCSVTIKTMLDCGMADGDDSYVPLPNVNADVLRRILEWATFHKGPLVLEEDENIEKQSDDISSWDADFLKVNQEILLYIIKAANYLDIKGLVHVASKTAANLIKGKTPEELRKLLHLKNDFSAAEEEQIAKDNEWCEEKQN